MLTLPIGELMETLRGALVPPCCSISAPLPDLALLNPLPSHWVTESPPFKPWTYRKQNFQNSTRSPKPHNFLASLTPHIMLLRIQFSLCSSILISLRTGILSPTGSSHLSDLLLTEGQLIDYAANSASSYMEEKDIKSGWVKC